MKYGPMLAYLFIIFYRLSVLTSCHTGKYEEKQKKKRMEWKQNPKWINKIKNNKYGFLELCESTTCDNNEYQEPNTNNSGEIVQCSDIIRNEMLCLCVCVCCNLIVYFALGWSFGFWKNKNSEMLLFSTKDQPSHEWKKWKIPRSSFISTSNKNGY